MTSRREIDAAIFEWKLALDARPIEGDDYHAFWDIWNAHAAKFEALTIPPEHREYADGLLDWMREIADTDGYFRASGDIPSKPID